MTTAAVQPDTASADEKEERAYLELRDQVTDEELIARMNGAPDCGGNLLVQLSDFVARRRTGALPRRDEPSKDLGA